MREEYDIKNLNPRRNPYVRKEKQQVTMNLNSDTVKYFKGIAQETGVSYQTLINLYLDECVKEKKRPQFV